MLIGRKILSTSINIVRFATMQDFIQKDKELRAEFDKLNKKAAYGTAGFRDLATNMPYVPPSPSRSPSEWAPSSPSTTSPSPTNTWESSSPQVTTSDKTTESKSPISEETCSKKISNPKWKYSSTKSIWKWHQSTSKPSSSKKDSPSMTRP